MVERRDVILDYLEKAFDEWRVIRPDGTPLEDVYVMLRVQPSVVQRPREGEEYLVYDIVPSLEADRSEASFDLFDVLQRTEHLVLMGMPGAGKTITLLYIALSYACKALRHLSTTFSSLPNPSLPCKASPCIPFLLHAPDLPTFLDKHDKWALEHALLSTWHRWSNNEISIDVIRDWLHHGRVVILLDSLDEVDPEWREKIRREIQDFHRRVQSCRLIISTRPSGYVPFGTPFREYTLVPLDETTILQFLRRWLAVLQEQKPDDIAQEEAQRAWDIIRSNASLYTLSQTPLTLKMLAEVVASSGPSELQQIHSRTELYRRYISKVLWQRAAERGTTKKYRSWAFALLETWAWARHTRNVCTEEELRSTLENTEWIPPGKKIAFPLLSPEDEATWRHVRDLLRAQLGILAVQQTEKGVCWVFTHPTWEEFFASQYLKRCWENNPKATWKFLKERLHADKWRECLLLLAAQLDDASDLVHRVHTACSPDERILHRDLVLALRMVKQGAKVSEKEIRHLEEKVSRLFIRWKRYASRPWLLQWHRRLSRHPRIASFLFGILHFSGILCVIPPLEVVSALERQNGPLFSQIKEMVYPLINSVDPYIRSKAIEMLVDLDPNFFAPQFFTLFWQERDRDVQIVLLKAMGRSGREEFATLFLSLLTHPEETVQEVCIQNLAELGSKVLPVLERFVATNSNPLTARLNAIEALGHMGPYSLTTLIKFINDGEERIREYVIKSLQNIYASNPPEIFEKILRYDESPSVRKAVLQSLQRWKHPKSVEILAIALEDEDAEVRALAIEMLSQMGDLAVHVVGQALYSDDVGIRSWAVESIGRLHLRNHYDKLLRMLNDYDLDIQLSAVRALGYLGVDKLNPSPDRVLKGVLGDGTKNSMVRKEAARSLGRLYRGTGNSNVSSCLLSVLYREPGEDIRRAIIEALSDIGEPNIIQKLRTLLGQEVSIIIRGTLIEALGRLKDRSVEKSLVQLLDSEEHLSIRVASAKALAFLATPYSISKLLQKIDNPEIGSEIRRQIGHLVTEDDVISALLSRIHDPKAKVRLFIVDMIGQWIHIGHPTPGLMERVASVLCKRLFDGQPEVVDSTYKTFQTISKYITNYKVDVLPIRNPCTTVPKSFWRSLVEYLASFARFIWREILIPLLRELLSRQLGN